MSAEGVALSGEKGLKPEGTLENPASSRCRRCKGQNPESLRQKDRAYKHFKSIFLRVLCTEIPALCFSVVTPGLIV